MEFIAQYLPVDKWRGTKDIRYFFLSLLLNKANHSLEWVLVSSIPPEIQRWSPCIDNLDTGATSFFKGTWPFLQFTTGLKWLYSQISNFFVFFFLTPFFGRQTASPLEIWPEHNVQKSRRVALNPPRRWSWTSLRSWTPPWSPSHPSCWSAIDQSAVPLLLPVPDRALFAPGSHDHNFLNARITSLLFFFLSKF